MLPAAELPAVARVNPVVVLIVITAFAMDPLARGHIEIPSSRAARASGIEVEGCAIARQRGTPVVGRRVNRGAQVRCRALSPVSRPTDHCCQGCPRDPT